MRQNPLRIQYAHTVKSVDHWLIHYSDYQKQCTIIKGKDVDFDYRKFNNLLVLNHTVEPNFKDAEFVKQVGAVYPEQAMGKVLLAGEISVLAEQIRKVSGFEDSLDDLVAQVKNS